MTEQHTEIDLAKAARQSTVLDDTAKSIANVYATALYMAASSQGESDSLLGELSEFRKVIEGNPRVFQLFSSPVIGRDEKSRLVKTVFQGHTSVLLSNFLMVLNERDRLDLIGAIIGEYVELDQDRKNQIRVHVTTAVPVSSSQEGVISAEVEKKIGKKPVLEFKVDPAILGGLIIRAKDWLWDDSLQNRLITLRNQLIERSTYEIQSGRNSFGSAEGN